METVINLNIINQQPDHLQNLYQIKIYLVILDHIIQDLLTLIMNIIQNIKLEILKSILLINQN